MSAGQTIPFFSNIKSWEFLTLFLFDNKGDDNDETSNNVEHNLINLATEDVSNVKEAFWNLQYVWALPIKMIVIVVFIYQKIGVTGCLGTVLGIVIIIPLQLLVGKFMIGKYILALVYFLENFVKLHNSEKIFFVSQEKFREIRI